MLKPVKQETFFSKTLSKVTLRAFTTPNTFFNVVVGLVPEDGNDALFRFNTGIFWRRVSIEWTIRDFYRQNTSLPRPIFDLRIFDHQNQGNYFSWE